VPVVVPGLSNVLSISAGEHHTCAVLDNGTACCWGRNTQGQLGDGTRTNSRVPVVVLGLTNVRSFSTGVSHTCAVLVDGTARCWGRNLYGQLGDGTTTQRTTPINVTCREWCSTLCCG
jgi:alpha-tubulin suppressor-like RCC1 family protein